MVTKGQVVTIIDRYTVTVRLPAIYRMNNTKLGIQDEFLNTATICTLPMFDPNIKPGDIVFVAFEDNNVGKPIIIGYLSSPNVTTKGLLNLDSIQVDIGAKLPEGTYIGNVTPQQIKYLSNVSDDIQKQIDFLKSQISLIPTTAESETEDILICDGGDCNGYITA